MYAFIDDQRALYGVEPICRVLEIAPSGYYEYRTRQTDPTRRPARAQRDDVLRAQVQISCGSQTSRTSRRGVVLCTSRS